MKSFKTPLFWCTLYWDKNHLTKISFQKAKGKNSEPPQKIQKIINQIVSYLSGKKINLQKIPLNLESFSPFQKKVYQVVREIPFGKTLSYKEVAIKAGSPKAARAVGQFMAKNPFVLLIPCHRVVGANRKLVGFSAGEGLKTKRVLLDLEKSV